MNKFDFTTMIPQLVFIRFLEEIEDNKKTFRNYLTFKESSKGILFILFYKKLVGTNPNHQEKFHRTYSI